jgi:hypothetical protein
VARPTQERVEVIALQRTGLSGKGIAARLEFRGRRSLLAPSLRWCSPSGRGSRLKIGPVGVRIPPPAPISRLRYLLGLYLGDGCITRMPRTHVMRIFLNDGQPDVIAEAARAISQLVPMPRVGFGQRGRCVIVRAYWGGWPTMMPQHGRGRKHLRQIVLEPWQEKHRRVVRGKNYPADAFSNRSKDILNNLFTWACRLLGIRYKQPSRIAISVARRPEVARLDAIMGRSWRGRSERPIV